MTGTLLGGYSSNLFYLLFRMDPGRLREDHLGYEAIQDFVARYGVLEKITRSDPDQEYNWTSRGSRPRQFVRERPGVCPALFSRHLLETTAFLDLADLSADLPSYREEVLLVQMDEPLYEAYKELEGVLREAVSRTLYGSRRLLGLYLHGLLSYPDRPFDNPPVRDPETGECICQPAELPKDAVYAKERALLDLVLQEKAAGRRVFVNLVYTQKRDIAERLRELFAREGVCAEVLRASVRPAEREDWIASAVRRGAEVVLANAELTKTGLDLYDFPTIVFAQTGYNLYTLRQASRRSWRIGQTQPVRVVFLAYRDTLQEAALQLMGSKLQAALALEGKFSEDGLRALAEGSDMATELAKALLHGLGDLDSAESIWRTLQPPVAGAAALLQQRSLDTAVRVVELAEFWYRRKRRKAPKGSAGTGGLPAVQLGWGWEG